MNVNTRIVTTVFDLEYFWIYQKREVTATTARTIPLTVHVPASQRDLWCVKEAHCLTYQLQVMFIHFGVRGWGWKKCMSHKIPSFLKIWVCSGGEFSYETTHMLSSFASGEKLEN